MRKVNPNRMELLRLKKRKVLAAKGHSLLEDKLEKLILEYHCLIKKFKEVSGEFEKVFNAFFEGYMFLRAEVSQEQFEALLESVTALEFEVTTRRLLNLDLPQLHPPKRNESYSPKKTPPQWDRLMIMKGTVLQHVCDLASIFIAVEKTSQEILKTRRRVNALEHILIPDIDGSIKFIENKLADLEREFLSQILRIKDLIRK